jgi:hypothetical protein
MVTCSYIIRIQYQSLINTVLVYKLEKVNSLYMLNNHIGLKAREYDNVHLNYLFEIQRGFQGRNYVYLVA